MHRTTGVLLATIALIATLSASAMDRARFETRADEAIATYGLSGQGVTVVILDRGIDYFHPDFRNEDGTTRVKWLLDMSNQNNFCDPANPLPVEYSEAQINAALDGSGPLVNSFDRVGHGTSTAGIAAGNGRAFADGKYRGIAPEADLVIVKYTSEGAPAHDNEPAETGFLACWDEALDWVDTRITALGQPAVALGNFGSQWGPMDGTSAFSRKIDDVFPPDGEGRIWVQGVGDEGGQPSHAGGDYTAVADTVIPFDISATGFYQASLWYDGDVPAQVSVSLDNGTFVGPIVEGGVGQQGGVRIFHYSPGFEPGSWASTSGDNAVYIDINGYVGGGEILIRALQSGTGRVDAYIPLASNLDFTGMLVPGRIVDIAATHSAIVLGAYVNKTEWVDIDGIQRFFTTEGAVDDVWTGSSDGPTRDGRLGVDLMTPGQNVFTSYGVNSWFATFDFNLVQDGGGFYGRFSAVSGAAPILLGAVALLLELDATLTTNDLRSILQSTAVADAFTGTVPNTQWGYGKLDVMAAAQAVAFQAGIDVDQDGVVNDADNCQMESNPDQRDTDGDGIGNVCDPDLSQDCVVNAIDLGIFRGDFFSVDPDADFNGDGIVNAIDLGTLKLRFFQNFLVDNPSGIANDCE